MEIVAKILMFVVLGCGCVYGVFTVKNIIERAKANKRLKNRKDD